MLADNALGRKDFTVPPFAKVGGIRPKWKVLRVVAIETWQAPLNADRHWFDTPSMPACALWKVRKLCPPILRPTPSKLPSLVREL